MNCPRCEARLDRLEAKDTTFKACGRCGGVWLDRRTWDRVRSAQPKAVVVAAERLAARSHLEPPTEGATIPCPACAHPMDVTRLAFAPLEVDVCPEHGVWFDRSELGQAVDALRKEAGKRPSGGAARTAALVGGVAVAGAAVGVAAAAAAPPPAAERAASGSGEDLGDALDVVGSGLDVADSGLLEGLGSLLEGAGELVGGLLEGLSGL